MSQMKKEDTTTNVLDKYKITSELLSNLNITDDELKLIIQKLNKLEIMELGDSENSKEAEASKLSITKPINMYLLTENYQQVIKIAGEKTAELIFPLIFLSKNVIFLDAIKELFLPGNQNNEDLYDDSDSDSEFEQCSDDEDNKFLEKNIGFYKCAIRYGIALENTVFLDWLIKNDVFFKKDWWHVEFALNAANIGSVVALEWAKKNIPDSLLKKNLENKTILTVAIQKQNITLLDWININSPSLLVQSSEHSSQTIGEYANKEVFDWFKQKHPELCLMNTILYYAGCQNNVNLLNLLREYKYIDEMEHLYAIASGAIDQQEIQPIKWIKTHYLKCDWQHILFSVTTNALFKTNFNQAIYDYSNKKGNFLLKLSNTINLAALILTPESDVALEDSNIRIVTKYANDIIKLLKLNYTILEIKGITDEELKPFQELIARNQQLHNASKSLKTLLQCMRISAKENLHGICFLLNGIAKELLLEIYKQLLPKEFQAVMVGKTNKTLQIFNGIFSRYHDKKTIDQKEEEKKYFVNT